MLTIGQGLYLFPTHPDCYILLLMTGKAFAHLPDHTWEDYNKMAPSLPKLKQIGLPVPAIPQPEAQASRQLQPQPHFQQLISQTQPQKNPPGSFVFVPHNCCPPAVPAINDFNNCCPPCNSTSSQTPYFAQAQHGRNGTLGGSLFGHSTHRGGEANDFSTTSSSFSNTHTTSWTSND